jgi:hypothetical protein
MCAGRPLFAADCPRDFRIRSKPLKKSLAIVDESRFRVLEGFGDEGRLLWVGTSSIKPAVLSLQP